ncbi:unnamed protein product [Protopolystoma xenopodis]|uniref:Uncharacterized protein n=1 Tax=Protopolystoma xenopodis TaxID=117903 RepID=A0A3S5BWM1_9PLAT|nr:unnamed protein product [Protopolystoma xenopodis]
MQTLAFCLLSGMVMRLKLFSTPQLCLSYALLVRRVDLLFLKYSYCEELKKTSIYSSPKSTDYKKDVKRSKSGACFKGRSCYPGSLSNKLGWTANLCSWSKQILTIRRFAICLGVALLILMFTHGYANIQVR